MRVINYNIDVTLYSKPNKRIVHLHEVGRHREFCGMHGAAATGHSAFISLLDEIWIDKVVKDKSNSLRLIPLRTAVFEAMIGDNIEKKNWEICTNCLLSLSRRLEEERKAQQEAGDITKDHDVPSKFELFCPTSDSGEKWHIAPTMKHGDPFPEWFCDHHNSASLCFCVSTHRPRAHVQDAGRPFTTNELITYNNRRADLGCLGDLVGEAAGIRPFVKGKICRNCLKRLDKILRLYYPTNPRRSLKEEDVKNQTSPKENEKVVKAELTFLQAVPVYGAVVCYPPEDNIHQLETSGFNYIAPTIQNLMEQIEEDVEQGNILLDELEEAHEPRDLSELMESGCLFIFQIRPQPINVEFETRTTYFLRKAKRKED